MKMKASEVSQTEKNVFQISVKYIAPTFSYAIDLDPITLEMKLIVFEQATAGRWLYRMSKDERSVFW
jgi:hypothetical protein